MSLLRAFLILTSLAAQPAATPSAKESIGDAAFVEKLMADFHVPGLSIAIIQDFQIQQTYAYGLASRGTRVTVTPKTLFQAASISKPVAAMASLRAVHLGRFGLDQDINTILKSWKLPADKVAEGRVVTPRMLMSHTSGLGDGFGFPGYDPGNALPTVVQILDGEKPTPQGPVRLERAPGSAFEYSGGGVMVQQLALTDAVGRPFARIAEDWVLGPIGMRDSTYDQPLRGAQASQAAHAHNNKGDTMNQPWHVYPEQAAAGLWTTPVDLAKFVIEVQRALRGEPNRVLPASLAREMITPVGVGPFAVGFSIGKLGEGYYFSHGGSNFGFQCHLLGHFSKGHGAVLMTNSDAGGRLISRLLPVIYAEFGWDAGANPVPRGYGPKPQER